VITTEDWQYMRLAIEQSEQAEKRGEVPVGAVLVYQNQVIAAAHNQPIAQQDPTAHAEVLVLRQAASVLKNYRLPGATLYVTLEPCAMCCGAMVHARIARCVFGLTDDKSGAMGSVMNIAAHPQLNHQIQVVGGLYEDVIKQQLRNFFRARRK